MPYGGYDVMLLFLPRCEVMPFRYDCHTNYAQRKRGGKRYIFGPTGGGGGYLGVC